MRWITAIGVLMVGMAATGCRSTMVCYGPRAVTVEQLWAGGDWRVTRIVGSDAELAAGRRVPELKFMPDGTVGGFSGVNTIGGSANVDALRAGRLELSPLVMTRMAGPPDAMKLESAFTQALNDPGLTWRIDGERLILSRGGAAVMELTRAK